MEGRGRRPERRTPSGREAAGTSDATPDDPSDDAPDRATRGAAEPARPPPDPRAMRGPAALLGDVDAEFGRVLRGEDDDLSELALLRRQLSLPTAGASPGLPRSVLSSLASP